jgi:hypothetical protein
MNKLIYYNKQYHTKNEQKNDILNLLENINQTITKIIDSYPQNQYYSPHTFKHIDELKLVVKNTNKIINKINKNPYPYTKYY